MPKLSHNTSVKFEQDHWDRIRDYCIAHNMSIGEFIREATLDRLTFVTRGVHRYPNTDAAELARLLARLLNE